MNIKEMYNTIPKQNKTGQDRITQGEWNAYINILSMQANANAKLLKQVLSNKNNDIDIQKLIDELKSFGGTSEIEYKEVDNLPTETIDLLDKNSTTLLNEIKTIFITVPPEVKHGFYSAINLRTMLDVNKINIIDNKNAKLKIIKFGIELDSIETLPQKTYNIIFTSDGINLYCFYLMV